MIGLALVLIAAMDSIRNLPATATFGWSAIFFYVIAVVTYLVPVALCSAELATTVGGGMYRWVREAFGSRWGFLAVWCDWSENIVWFPTVLVFLATTAAYVVNPDLAQNKAFLVPVMLVIFWAVTLSSLFGSLKSARWTGVGVVIGVFVNNINTYYWMLTALVAQTFLVMYFLMYLSVVRLRITKPQAPRPFKIPGGRPGLVLVTGAGMVGALFTFFLGFIPASHLSLAGTITYVGVMAFGMIAIVGTPFLLHRGPSVKVDTQADPNLLGPVADPAATGEKALV